MALRHKARTHSTPLLVSGFTLVELMVVLSIIAVVTGTVLTHQSTFNKSLVLANTAYDVGLTLRSAQVYGIGSRVSSGGFANAGYGLHFERATPGSFVLFADSYPLPSVSSECHPTSDAGAPDAKPGNCAYDAGQSENVSTYAFGNGVTVSDFCVLALGSWSCAYAEGGTLSSLDIVFARPNPDPFMSVNGTYASGFPISRACITLTSRQGGSEFISVSSSGQISAEASSCP